MAGSQSVVVTGTSSGMGKVIAETLARQGYRVFAAMRDISGRNAVAADTLRSVEAPHTIVPIEIDVTDDASVQRGIGQVLEHVPEIDILINCAGVMWTGTTEAFSIHQFRQVMETNVFGPFRMYKGVLPNMRARNSGLIITITSTCGRLIPPGLGIYASSKFAIDALAEALGYEVSGLGIDTVIVQPGPFDTNLMANQQPPEDQAIVAEYGEFGRLDTTVSERLFPLLAASGVSLDPQQVADLIAELIEMKPGKRPIRTTVGMDAGVTEMNRSIEQSQHAFLKAVGCEGLMRMSA